MLKRPAVASPIPDAPLRKYLAPLYHNNVTTANRTTKLANAVKLYKIYPATPGRLIENKKKTEKNNFEDEIKKKKNDSSYGMIQGHVITGIYPGQECFEKSGNDRGRRAKWTWCANKE